MLLKAENEIEGRETQREENMNKFKRGERRRGKNGDWKR